MILYQTLGTPYYDPSYERYCFAAKIGDGSEEGLVEDDMMFETEKEAWAVYHKSNSTFEFLDEKAITEIILACRNGTI